MTFNDPVPQPLPPTHEGPREPRIPFVLKLLIPGFVVACGAAVLLGLAVAEPPPEPTSLTEVRSYDVDIRGHTEESVDYDITPPVGGRHHPVWLDCGVYDEPVGDEYAVHDLEHGTIWITYDPELAAEDVDLLEQALPTNGILSPYPGQDFPVIVTVWGRQLSLNGAADPGLADFIAEFGDGATSPEPFSSCAGGLRNPPELESDGAAV